MPLKPRKRRRNKPGGNESHFDLQPYLYRMAGVDLTQIDGINALTVHKVISKTGVDMSPWPTVKHFTSRLSLSPCNDKTGGKVIKKGTKKIKNRAAIASHMAAYNLSRSQSALGAFFRRMKARTDAPTTVSATADKLARIIYSMFKNHEETQVRAATKSSTAREPSRTSSAKSRDWVWSICQRLSLASQLPKVDITPP